MASRRSKYLPKGEVVEEPVPPLPLPPLVRSITPVREEEFRQDAGREDLIENLRIHQLELEMQNHELRRTQLEAEESRNKYFDLYNFSPIGYATFDRKGTILDANLTLARMLGLERSALLLKPFTDAIPLEMRPAFMLHCRQMINGEHRNTCELKLVRSDGVSISVLLHSIPIATAGGAVGQFRSAVSDITHLKLLEAAQRASEEKFRQLFYTESDAIVISEANTLQFTDINDAALKLYGYSKEEFLRLSIADVTGDPDKTRKTYRDIVEGKCVAVPVQWHRRKDGSIFPVDISAGTFSLNNSLMVCAIIRDITERIRSEKELQNSQEHYHTLFLEARMMQEHLRSLSKENIRVQEEERARISRELHDQIGQALTAINMNLEILKKDVGNNSAARQRLVEAQRLTGQTLQIVHDFSEQLRPPVLDELGLIPALRSYTRSFEKRTGIAIQLRSTTKVEKIGSEQKIVLYRIVQESLTNVSKHAQARHVRISLRKVNNDITLEISDDGRGIDPEELQSVDGKQKKLGLIGMKERVRLVDGVLFVDTQKRKGTTIRVEIPFKSMAPGDRDSEHDKNEGSSR